MLTKFQLMQRKPLKPLVGRSRLLTMAYRTPNFTQRMASHDGVRTMRLHVINMGSGVIRCLDCVAFWNRYRTYQNLWIFLDMKCKSSVIRTRSLEYDHSSQVRPRILLPFPSSPLSAPTSYLLFLLPHPFKALLISRHSIFFSGPQGESVLFRSPSLNRSFTD